MVVFITYYELIILHIKTIYEEFNFLFEYIDQNWYNH